MEVEFVSQGKIVHTGKINEKIILNTTSFSIPISVCSDKDINDNISSPSSDFLNKKTERKNDDSYEDQNITNNNNINMYPKKKNYYRDDYESEEEEDDNDEESEEYEESDNELSEENDDSDQDEDGDNTNANNKNNSDYDNSLSNNTNKKKNKLRGDSSESSSKNNNQRMLRKYGAITEKDHEFYGLGGSGNKKVKKELTEEEIAKKTEQARLRKLHAKKLIEEEKREAVERILNEDGRKLRERQKKHNEEMKKKTKLEEEKMKINLTKIITKYSKDGKIYVRFPQGFLLPSVFNQQKKVIKEVSKCHVEGCPNLRKYTDPKTGFPYCSVKCFKILRSQIQPNKTE
jgi:hypothetical protein